MAQRLAVIGFIIAAVIAVFAFTQQQQALNRVNELTNEQAAADGARRRAETEKSTAVAQAGTALAQQAAADTGRVTAVAQAKQSADKQASAESALATAQAQAAVSRATAQAAVNAEMTAEAETTEQATALAKVQADLSTAQAQLAVEATQEATLVSALGTVTAQVDLARFSQSAAEEDRAAALTQAWGAATIQARLRSELATVQARLDTSQGTPIAAAPTAAPTTMTNTQATVTLAPQPTAGVTPTALSTELTENFTSQNGAVKFKYPTGWVVRENNSGIFLTTSLAALTNQGDPKSGDFVTSLAFFAASDINGLTASSTVGEVVSFFANRIVRRSNPTSQAPDPTTLTIENKPAARVVLRTSALDLELLAIDLGGSNFGLAIALTAPNEMTRFDPVLRAVLGSSEFTGR